MTLGNEIKRLRNKCGYTQEQLAAKFGVSRQAVAKWEAGANSPDLEKVVQLASLFGVTTDQLLVESEDLPLKKQALAKVSRVENERIVNQALRSSMAHANPEQSLDGFLAHIGAQIGCDRVYVFEPYGEDLFRNSYEWCAHGVEPQIDYLQGIPRAEMNVWLDVFASGDFVFIEDVDAIEKTNPVVYRWIKPQGIRSLLAYPLFGGRAILGVDNPAPAFVHQTLSLIEIMVHFVELMLQQRDLQQELSVNLLQSRQVGRLGGGAQYRLNLITGALDVDEAALKQAGYYCPFSSLAQLRDFAAGHPEFERIVMVDGIDHAIQTRQNVTVEFISYKQDGAVRWNKLTISPFLGSSQRVLQLYGVLQDKSESHGIVRRYNSYAPAVSGGLHVCHLSEPSHLIYASNELCQLLGYEHEELQALAQGEYANLMVEQDRERFRSFVARLASVPRIESCEYRLVCKDGSVIEVVDTMESIESSSGNMYGYAFVLEKTQLQALLDMAGERERAQQAVISQQYDVLSALGSEYQAVFRVWLDQDKAQVVESCSSAVMTVGDRGYLTLRVGETAACASAQSLDDDAMDLLPDHSPWLEGAFANERPAFVPYYACCVKYVRNFVHPDDREKMLQAMHPDSVRQALTEDGEFSVVYRVKSAGKESYFQMKCIRLSAPRDSELRLVVAFKNVDAIIQGREAMKYAYADAMTGVMNRNAFERDFEQLADADQVGFAFCDVNGLKEVNDCLGHASGDALLMRFAKLLRERFSADCIYRIGGDEFVCMVKGVGCESFCQRAQELAEAALADQGLASVGYAHGGAGRKTALLLQAEKNMYAVKANSRR